MRSQRWSSVLMAGVLTVTAGCGSGGDSEGDPIAAVGTAEGVWQGVTSTNRAVAGYVKPNGDYWFLYSVPGAQNLLGGAFQGNASMNAGQFTSSDGMDYDLNNTIEAPTTATGTYVKASSLSGTFTHQDGRGAGIQLVYKTYTAEQLERIPTMLYVSRTAVGVGGPSLLQVYPDGGVLKVLGDMWVWGPSSITSSRGRCRVSGTLTPTGSSQAAYDLTIDPSPGVDCGFTEPLTGVLISDPERDSIYVLVS